MTLTPERWRRITEICNAALARGESERAALLADACSGDEALRREVQSLLDQSVDGFLEVPALADTRSLAMLPTAVSPHAARDEASRLVPGQRFGPYRIERLLGRGGMGEVYEAEHEEHGRRVALKVLTHGLSDASDRARFLREGQLAAAVSHPHIVYIYGSEEIDGIPVITMELLAGGTLKDRVEDNGPLPPGDAIDAILQVVSGLEAAHAAGILHRDIKPSNCFVDADGTVKVGDFGLSIPTVAHDVTQLTKTGTFRGTPQFASPEQLRGRPVDVRSDIYAVGATLHCLLTGRPPFDDSDLMALISRITTESPPSLRRGRPEIPEALATIVLQCLAKDPEHRPASYRSLTSVLEPLSSSIKAPAPLGTRAAAYVFDGFFSAFLPLNMLTALAVLTRPSSMWGATPVVAHLLEVAYFAITEGVWGASLGKALCGLRVVTESGTRPRFARALVRALVFVLPRWFASGLVLSMAGLVYSMRGSSAIITIVVEAAVQALLFVTARRANGFAGIHERATRTRTVSKSAVGVHSLAQAAPSPIDVPASPRWVGPYRIAGTSSVHPHGGAALGYDERLKRAVWLRLTEVDADPVSHVRRTLRRPTRLRWLAGQRTSALAWDAYEHVPGQPLDTLVRRAQSWGMVRGWLGDLAEEITAAIRDGSAPALELDRVWIGNDGRAKLLDWPAPDDRHDLARSPPSDQTVDLPQAERFLYRVAMSALEGQVLPIPAADCLAKLREQRFTTSEEMLTAVRAAGRGPAAISRTKRVVHLSLCAIPTIFMVVIGVISVYLLAVAPRQDSARPDHDVRTGVASAHPKVRSVSAGEAADRDGVAAGDVVVAIDGVPIAFESQLRDAIATHPDQPMTLSILRDGQPLMIRATPERRANQGWLGITIALDEPEISLRVTWRYLWLHAIAGLMLAGSVGLLSALAARGGIALRLLSVAVVTRSGTLASGSRVRLRAALSWLPVLAASAAAFAGHSPLLSLTPQVAQFFVINPVGLHPVFFLNEPSALVARVTIMAVALVVFALAVILAVIRPERGLQDRLAGTWLVPR